MFREGDHVRISVESPRAGYLYVVDRAKDMINSSGFKVWPSEVEEVLLQHPGIAQIYEANTADTGFGPQAYFAMELIRGQSLEMYGDARQLNTRQRLALMEKICEAVHHALQKLSPELREAVILRDLQDMDYKEIATVLKVPEGTVKSRINRGRAELARLLQRTYKQVM